MKKVKKILLMSAIVILFCNSGFYFFRLSFLSLNQTELIFCLLILSFIPVISMLLGLSFFACLSLVGLLYIYILSSIDFWLALILLPPIMILTLFFDKYIRKKEAKKQLLLFINRGAGFLIGIVLAVIFWKQIAIIVANLI